MRNFFHTQNTSRLLKAVFQKIKRLEIKLFLAEVQAPCISFSSFDSLNIFTFWLSHFCFQLCRPDHVLPFFVGDDAATSTSYLFVFALHLFVFQHFLLHCLMRTSILQFFFRQTCFFSSCGSLATLFPGSTPTFATSTLFDSFAMLGCSARFAFCTAIFGINHRVFAVYNYGVIDSSTTFAFFFLKVTAVWSPLLVTWSDLS